ncbi:MULTISPECIES: hypothetical protein [Sphingobacterium]|uniref:Uncharacterized protein n=1 Tax=Sphingobacterium litopenaei TaxID=2763500 RepID=A0ABR7YCP3_9SPHI|nr:MULTISPECIES: hypothetical protein [Sphingobacterium]MBD1429068.1 hypothetical protein [Sphingobacterium litopenaei]NGM72415.1 hypothetical protein [Sphingobacterium sp. SGL-16]
MYILRKPIALLGVAAAALSTIFCPFLKVPIKGNWNLYETDTSLFLITLGILGLAVLFFVSRKIAAFRFVSIAFFIWTILGLVAVYFKINNYFGMKLVDGLLAKTLHIKWGWAVLILSAVIMVLSVGKVKEVK